ncbi:MAG: hypothetical protein P1U32_01340 [Legionellaceae bacterium]|nr:hypothetical protein [Legionellaceae bacterium]
MPVLLSKITDYAKLEQEGSLPGEGDALFQSYSLLKQQFAAAYGLSALQEEHFTWTVFASFLYQYNFTGIEIVFAPVLRPLINLFYELDTPDEAWHARQTPSDLADFRNTNITSTGRYIFLSYSLVNRFFNNYFNIDGHVHVFLNGAYHDVPRSVEDEDVAPSHSEIIHVYLKDQHYERTIDEAYKDAYEVYEKESKALPKELKAIQEELGKCDEYASLHALGALFLYGRKKLSDFILQSQAIDAEQRAQLEAQKQPDAKSYVAQHVNEFNDKSDAEKKSIAIMLLILLHNAGNKRANYLLNKMRIASGTKEATELAEAVFNRWDNLDAVKIKQVEKPTEAPSSFYFNCMVGLAVAGAAILVVAILVQPAALMPFANIMVGAGIAALLASTGMFVARQLGRDEQSDTNTPELK